MRCNRIWPERFPGTACFYDKLNEVTEMKLIYKEPATRWGEALPLGNGQIGAMIYGGDLLEKICLTENTFFSGEAEKEANQNNAAMAFQKMRKAARENDYIKVHQEAAHFIGKRENYGTHLPTGDLWIRYQCRDGLKEFERGLEIDQGRAWVSRQYGKIRILEEVRVSHPDKVMMITIDSSEKTGFSVCFDPYNGEGECEGEENGFRFFVNAYETIHCDQKTGVHLEGAFQLKTDGKTCFHDGQMEISDSTHTTIYLAMETDFGQKNKSGDDLYCTAKKRCTDARGLSERFLIERHEKDMEKLTKGTKIELKGTDELSEKIPLLFQYGRYLLFCSSREDSKLPAHLQGIWNDNVACRIGWTCDMHLDINTQMNYWPAEFSGLSDSATPLFRWIRDILLPEGRRTAKISYGMEGWVGELVSNAWGYAAPYWSDTISPCPTGGVWILTHLWEHYLYTEDKEFLRDQAFPMIDEAVRFFEQYVYETDNGEYTCGPSISPENSFLYQGKNCQISSGCTYEILMIRELFQIYLKASDILEKKKDRRYKKIQELCKKLLPYRILKDGCIAEWNHDLPEVDPQHRHTSHLLGLFPFSQITPEETPELCRAAEQTISKKLTPEEKWEDTGWARSMLMLYEARLHNGEKAYAHMRSMIEHLLEPNQMVYHPPTRGAGAFDNVYELDGNTGLCTCIGEMLVQSHGGRLRLLPALPDEWKEGIVTGFHVRGNVTVDLKWKAGKLTEAVLYSSQNCKQTVVWDKKEIRLEFEGECRLTKEDFKKGRSVG